MAQPTSNPKIEELRFRIKADPKSRLFYPLAEELRKISQWDESERVLRGGLEHHPTYLSAWVSLGRVLRDQHKDDGAIEALTKALQLDPGNVVAARLLGDSYLTKGEKVEAIKKYKLVLALMPGDQEVESIVEGLEREINPIVLATVGEDEAGPVAGNDSPVMPAAHEEAPPPVAAAPAPEESPFDESPIAEVAEPGSSVSAHATPFGVIDHPMDETRPQSRPHQPEESPWASSSEAERKETTEAPFAADVPWSAPTVGENSTGDDEPMRLEHSESPFEEPSGYTSAALSVEQPSGMHVDEPPAVSEEGSIWAEPAAEPVSEVSPWGEEPASEPASPWGEEPSAIPEAADVFAPAAGEGAGAEDVSNTLTMADLYAGQGQSEQARLIYERILERDPGNDAVRGKLAGLSAAAPVADVRVEKLGRWLSKVGRREGGGV